MQLKAKFDSAALLSRDLFNEIEISVRQEIAGCEIQLLELAGKNERSSISPETAEHPDAQGGSATRYACNRRERDASVTSGPTHPHNR